MINTIEKFYGGDSANFSGEIYDVDFNTCVCGFSSKGSYYADRIMRDMKFDDDCKKAAMFRDTKVVK